MALHRTFLLTLPLAGLLLTTPALADDAGGTTTTEDSGEEEEDEEENLRKLLSILSPTFPDFSGWNCVPKTLPLLTAATNGLLA